MKKTKLRLNPLAAAIAFVSGTVAIPQMTIAQEESGLQLEEVIVTAQKREQSLQDVPVAVSALTGTDLAIRGTGNIAELAQEVPSLTLEASRATNSTLTAFIRGVGQQDPLAGFEQGVGIYLDDVYLARPQGAMLDVYEVERIEVLRGPQGSLYGRNTVGGAVKYVTKRLGEETELRGKLGVGSYGQADIILTGSTPVSDTLRVGATIASLTRDGYGENITTGEENYDKDLQAARVSVEYLPSDDVFVRLTADKSEDSSAPVGGHRLFTGAVSGETILDDIFDSRGGASENYVTEDINGDNNIEAEGVHLTVQWDVSDEVTIKSVTAHRNDYTVSVIDFDSLSVDDFDAAVVYDNEQNSQEFQLNYTGDTLKAVVGFYLLDAYAANDFDVALGQLGRVAFGDELIAYTGGVVETDSWSFYGDFTFSLTDQLDLGLGARYTSDKRTADVFRALYLGGSSPFFGGVEGVTTALLAPTSDFESQKTFSNFSPKINLSYQVNDDVNVYGGISQGWKAGGFDPRGANLTADAVHNAQVEAGYDEESIVSTEIGAKTTWWDGRARTNVAIFHASYTDMQVPGSAGVDTDGDGTNDDFEGSVTNAGEATIQGIELEAEIALLEGLTLQVSGTLLDASIDEWIASVETAPGSGVFVDADIADIRVVQNTPEEQGFIGLRYSTDVFGGELISSLNYAYKGDSSQFEAENEFIDQESYSTVGASVVWMDDDGKWIVGLHGKNLTDEEIKTSGYCFGASAGCGAPLGLEDNTTAFYAPPMTVTATIEYSLF